GASEADRPRADRRGAVAPRAGRKRAELSGDLRRARSPRLRGLDRVRVSPARKDRRRARLGQALRAHQRQVTSDIGARPGGHAPAFSERLARAAEVRPTAAGLAAPTTTARTMIALSAAARGAVRPMPVAAPAAAASAASA